jgi:signal transduction histidine kinase/ligand-binding sensor domain-containing protein
MTPPRLIFLLLLQLMCAAPAWSLDSGQGLKHYHHDSWTAKDGAPGDITAMAQTRDGWLWLGTGAGLFRFDGVRFEKFTPAPGQHLLSSSISHLWADDGGGLWIGYLTGGMSLLDKGALTQVAEDKSDSPVRAYNMEKDIDGSVWVAAFRGLCHYVGGKWQFLQADSGFPGPQAKSVFLDRAGRLWVSNGQQLYQLDRSSGKFVAADIAGNADHLAQGPDGRLWLGTKTSWRVIAAPPTPMPASAAAPLHASRPWGLFDRDDNFWSVRCPAGICRTAAADVPPVGSLDTAAEPTERLDQPWQASSLTASNMFEDREGNIWVGTQGGLERFRHSKLAAPGQVPVDTYYRLAQDGQGQLWAATRPGNALFKLDRQGATELDRLHDELAIGTATDGSLLLADRHRLERRRGGRSDFIALPPGADGKPVDNHPLVVMGDADNAWVGITPRGVYHWTGAQWIDASKHGFPTGGHLAMTMRPDGSVWMAFRNGQVVSYARGKLEKYQLPATGFGIVKMLAAGKDVVAAGEHGVAVLRDGRFQLLHATDPEPLSGVSGMVDDGDGDYWLNGGKGVVHVRAADWAAARARPDSALRYELFDALDGYPGAASSSFYKPSALRAADGTLWFVASGGIVYLDKTRLRRNLLAPPVLIRDLATNDGSYPAAPSAAQLPPNTANLRFRYTALTYSMPERVRFRYKLEGVDADWQDAGTRREAFYTHLPPGQYRFRVGAVNEEGVASAEDAAMDFAIAPTFVQTRWFQLLCGLLVALALYAAYALRMRQLARHFDERAQVRLQERESIARTLHDTLLQSMHGLLLSFHGVSIRLPADSDNHVMMKKILDRADDVMDESRQLIMALRMTTAYGDDLNGALAVAGRSLQETFPSEFQMVVDGAPGVLHAAPAEDIYYIAKEALFNAFQHAEASLICLALDYSADCFTMTVEDDGKGIDAEVQRAGHRPGHWGLAGMRERSAAIGAVLSVQTLAERGTRIVLTMQAKALYRAAPRGGIGQRLAAWRKASV